MVVRHKTFFVVVGVLVISILAVTIGLMTYNKNTDSSCITVEQTKHCASGYIDLSETEATNKARNDGFTAKIRERDGNINVINHDIGGRPIYFIVNDGVVTEAAFE